MNETVEKILSQLTLEEKAGLCSGKDFWHLKGVSRLGLDSIMVTDGPHGLRKQAGDSDHVGLNASVPATCFPTASATASSWDPDLMYEMGVALGEECLQENVAVLLGPGANIKRSPLCGRNFEYISEDPYHTGVMGAAIVNGVQSQGVGTSLKHFAANNQEYRRMATESVLDERTLREIYLAGFEKIVKESQPWTVMCAYNMVDGYFCSDSKKLLTDILKEEWGHTGLVVTDWGACNDRIAGIKAGMELEMPASAGLNDQKIIEAVNDGTLTIEELDKVVRRLLDLIVKSMNNKKDNYTYDVDAHDSLARKAAAQSAVLLKNEDNILPLKKEMKLAIIGEFAKTPRYQGSGSSLIKPIRMHSALDELEACGCDYTYYQGYDSHTDMVDKKMIDAAAKGATDADVAIVFAGLTDLYESEGFDRKHLNMPTNHNALIEAVCKVSSKVVVVLQNGAPVEMPWLDGVQAVLESYLGGQAGGQATVDILLGKVNPSGKLAETFPIKLEDDFATKWFANSKKTVEYRENLYVGYRYYDSAKKEVLFPFGFGLSYTSFEYSDMTISENKISDDQTITCSLKVKNTGDVAGAEIVQFYVKDVESTIFRPEKELKAFKKIFLEAGEETAISITLDSRAFAYYNVDKKDWHVETGEFQVLVGASSRDIRLTEAIHVESTDKGTVVPDLRDQVPEYYDMAKVTDIKDSTFENILGKKIPVKDRLPGEKFTLNSTMEDVSGTFVGGQLYKMTLKGFKKMVGDEDEKTARMMEAMIKDMPLRSMVLMGGGRFNFQMADGLVQMINGHFFRGLGKVIKNRK